MRIGVCEWIQLFSVQPTGCEWGESVGACIFRGTLMTHDCDEGICPAAVDRRILYRPSTDGEYEVFEHDNSCDGVIQYTTVGEGWQLCTGTTVEPELCSCICAE